MHLPKENKSKEKKLVVDSYVVADTLTAIVSANITFKSAYYFRLFIASTGTDRTSYS